MPAVLPWNISPPHHEHAHGQSCSEQCSKMAKNEQFGGRCTWNAESCRVELSGKMASCTPLANWLVILTGCRRNSCGKPQLQAVNFHLYLFLSEQE